MPLKSPMYYYNILLSFLLGILCSACSMDSTKSCVVGLSSDAFVDGLVAYYPFDGTTNDESGNCRHGTVGGNPIFVDGVQGKAISFDGLNDFVEIEGDNSPLPATAYTITEPTPDRLAGIIDEIRIYDRVLSVDEERSIFAYYAAFLE